MVSTRSSIVTSPSMPPYSSTTSARWMCAWRICSSRSSTGDLRRHHQRLAQDRLERERLRPADIGEHVLDVHHADDVIELLAIHRQARMTLGADLLAAPVPASRRRAWRRCRRAAPSRRRRWSRAGAARWRSARAPGGRVRAARRRPRLLVGGFLHQFGDRFAHASAPAARPSSWRSRSRRIRAGAVACRSCALPRIGHAQAVQDARLGQFHAARVAGVVVVVPGEVQRAMHHQMRQMVRGAARRRRRPRAGSRRAPAAFPAAGRGGRRSARWSACCGRDARAFSRWTAAVGGQHHGAPAAGARPARAASASACGISAAPSRVGHDDANCVLEPRLRGATTCSGVHRLFAGLPASLAAPRASRRLSPSAAAR